MRYADIKANDIVDGEGVCVSFWTQGCPHRCLGCHNPLTWDFNGGIEKNDAQLTKEIIDLISKNGVKRNFSVLGGEPLCPENKTYVATLISQVRLHYPSIKIFLWTGYTLKELQEKNDNDINSILQNIDTLIDGRYSAKDRDITLKFRGSKNQQVLQKNIDF